MRGQPDLWRVLDMGWLANKVRAGYAGDPPEAPVGSYGCLRHDEC